MLGIVAAFKEEVIGYLNGERFGIVARDGSLRFYESSVQPEIVVVVGGFGRERAQDAARQLIERYKPDFVVSAGFAGGARAGLRPGDLFLCDNLMSIEGPPTLWTSESAREGPAPDMTLVDVLKNDNSTGKPRQEYGFCGCMSVPQLISSSSLKAWIGSTFPVSIIDMESYWVSGTASAYGIPYMAVRSVLDPMEQTLPEFVGETVDDEGGRWRRALKYVVNKPMSTPKLIHLATQARAARASLGALLAMLGSAQTSTA